MQEARQRKMELAAVRISQINAELLSLRGKVDRISKNRKSTLYRKRRHWEETIEALCERPRTKDLN